VPLVPQESRVPDATLRELYDSLVADLPDLEAMIVKPKGTVLDPASLDTALELLSSARAVVDGPAPSDRAELLRRTNLAYAVLLSVIDLVKSHTDVPKVPQGPKGKTE
jgi:hypothetical protein